jgi:repressor LexA
MDEEKRHAPFRGLIAKRMEQLGVRTVEEFGERFGITRGTMYTLYSGRISSYGTLVKPSVETLVALSRALQTPIHELIYLLGPNAIGQENYNELGVLLLRSRSNPNWANILSELDIPSRFAPELVDLYPVGWTSNNVRELAGIAVGYAWIYSREDADLEAFSAFGDSMTGGAHPIYSGDIIVTDRLDRAETGDLVVIRLEDGVHLCRLLHIGQYVATNPLKADPTPIVLNPNEAELIGRVVEIRHTFKAHS